MTNYDLEEDELLKLQIGLSIVFIFTIIVSISLSYDAMMEHEGKDRIYSSDEALTLLRINRTIAFLVAIGFIYINVRDKYVKEKYDVDDDFANVQILASLITFVSSSLVLYVAFSGASDIIIGENPN